MSFLLLVTQCEDYTNKELLEFLTQISNSIEIVFVNCFFFNFCTYVYLSMKFNTFQHFFDTKFSFASLCYRNKNLSIMVLPFCFRFSLTFERASHCLFVGSEKEKASLLRSDNCTSDSYTLHTLYICVVKTQLVVTRYCTSLKLFR